MTNATRLEFTGNGYLYNINSPTQVNGTEYTLSCYAKRNDSGTQSFGFFTNGSGSVNSAMTLTSEWKRFDYTYTATNASQLGLAGSSGADVSVFGFQVEASASYATSYIPTMGVSATRSKDFINQNIQALTSGLTEGTLFVEFEKPNTGENVDLMRLKGSGTLGRAFIYNTAAGFASNWGSASQLNIGGGDNNKAAWRLDSLSSGVEFINGVKGAGGSGTAWSDIRELRFNAEGNGGVLKIKQILFFPTALTDAECITLTTL